MDPVKDRLRRARSWARSLVGADVYHRPQVRRPVTRLGGRGPAGYGAWNVYAEPLGPESVVYSVGVGDDISFDEDVAAVLGAAVHAFDPTPESVAWVERRGVPPGFEMHPVAVGGEDGTAAFFPHENADWVSHSVVQNAHNTADAVEVPVRRLGTLMAELGHGHVDLLKMDVEGAEYAVIDDLCASGLDVRQVLVEFHHRFSAFRPAQTRRAIERLNAAGYRSFAVSPNGEEYSFVKV